MARQQTPPVVRFLRQVRMENGHWIWMGGRTSQIRIGGREGRSVLVQRWAYEAFIGPIPDGFILTNTCAIGGCIRPACWKPEVFGPHLAGKGTGPTARPDIERFMNKVRFEGDGCWIWAGAISSNGYGVFGSPATTAHRWSYRFFVGPIAQGLHVDHLCRVRACVRPSHLEPVTPYENQHRSPLTCATRTHCPKGHPYDEQNTLIERSGRKVARVCRVCKYARMRRTPRIVTRAQGKLRYAVKTGRVVKPTHCEECGRCRRLQGAHWDYTRPLLVRWLCSSCHAKWDAASPKTASLRSV